MATAARMGTSCLLSFDWFFNWDFDIPQYSKTDLEAYMTFSWSFFFFYSIYKLLVWKQAPYWIIEKSDPVSNKLTAKWYGHTLNFSEISQYLIYKAQRAPRRFHPVELTVSPLHVANWNSEIPKCSDITYTSLSLVVWAWLRTFQVSLTHYWLSQ